jgi:hypothetical protein
MQTFFEAIMERAGDVRDVPTKVNLPTCIKCARYWGLNTDGVCERCVIEAQDEARGYSIMMLAGRCANGAERDAGTRWHAVPIGQYKAKCGITYGRRSGGWSSAQPSDRVVTCPRCIKKLERKGE